jgi:hypothetical protein
MVLVILEDSREALPGGRKSEVVDKCVYMCVFCRPASGAMRRRGAAFLELLSGGYIIFNFGWSMGGVVESVSSAMLAFSVSDAIIGSLLGACRQ